MASVWPTADEDPSAPEHVKEYARIWRDKPRVVFSATLEQVEWNSKLVRGDIAQEVRQLKERPGNEMSVGGAGLAATFMRLDLIGEYRLYVHPVILGGGKPMFGPLQDRIDLQLVEMRTFGSGIVLLRYQRAEAPR